MRFRLAISAGLALTVFVSTFSCIHWMYKRPGETPPPGQALSRLGDEIVVAGQLFHTGTRVVLWLDAKGYDAYRAQPVFTSPVPASRPAATRAAVQQQRYGARGCQSNALEAAVATDGWTLNNLRQQIDQFVIHYDVCGTSRACFRVLQDMRTLSVPFMLDVDGTIYQTLDLKERAWHAGEANDRSVGIEIAHMGAYAKPAEIQRYYAADTQGPYFVLPAKESGVLTPNFIPRPARKELLIGEVNGRNLHQYDFTNEQYAALIKLTATLHRVLPNIALDVPRNADGSVRNHVLTPEELASWSGLLGHYHITTGKIDPGPAFDWERVLEGARAME